MAYVSVGQVENLEETIVGLQSAYDSMESVCHAQIAIAEAKVIEAQQEADNSTQLLDAAIEAEMEATPERDDIIQFIRNSSRGIMKGYTSSM